jgi:hypothetical protein
VDPRAAARRRGARGRATKFAILETSSRLRRLAWRSRKVEIDESIWDRLPDAAPPALQAIEHRQLLAALRRAIDEQLTERQRFIFQSVTMQEVPTDVLAERLARETIKAIYLHGSNRPELVSPDAWESDIALLQRPHAERLHLDLFYDSRTNVPLYPRWQAFLRERQPQTLIFWWQGDLFFTPAGGDAYLADLPSAEHRLDGGHFAVEEHLDYVAKHIEHFYSNRVSPATRSRAA